MDYRACIKSAAIALVASAAGLAPAIAQDTGACGDVAIEPLTADRVAAWVESFAAFTELADNLPEEHGAEAADIALSTLERVAAVPAALETLDTAAGDYGFDGFCVWLEVGETIADAYFVTKMNPDERGMAVVDPAVRQNVDAVEEHEAAVADIVER